MRLRARYRARSLEEDADYLLPLSCGTVTVAERPTRAIVVTVGLLLAGTGGLVSRDLAIGTVTMATATWLLLGAVGLLQLIAAMHVTFARSGR